MMDEGRRMMGFMCGDCLSRHCPGRRERGLEFVGDEVCEGGACGGIHECAHLPDGIPRYSFRFRSVPADPASGASRDRRDRGWSDLAVLAVAVS